MKGCLKGQIPGSMSNKQFGTKRLQNPVHYAEYCMRYLNAILVELMLGAHNAAHLLHTPNTTTTVIAQCKHT